MELGTKIIQKYRIVKVENMLASVDASGDSGIEFKGLKDFNKKL